MLKIKDVVEPRSQHEIKAEKRKNIWVYGGTFVILQPSKNISEYFIIRLMAIQFMALVLPVKTALETCFGRALTWLSVRILEILSLWRIWREMLNVPSILSESLNTLRLQSFRYFVPRKNYCVYYFSHVMLTTALIRCRYNSVCSWVDI